MVRWWDFWQLFPEPSCQWWCLKYPRRLPTARFAIFDSAKNLESFFFVSICWYFSCSMHQWIQVRMVLVRLMWWWDMRHSHWRDGWWGRTLVDLSTSLRRGCITTEYLELGGQLKTRLGSWFQGKSSMTLAVVWRSKMLNFILLFLLHFWRWRCLRRSLHMSPEHAQSVILACCVMHNYLRTESCSSYTPGSAILLTLSLEKLSMVHGEQKAMAFWMTLDQLQPETTLPRPLKLESSSPITSAMKEFWNGRSDTFAERIKILGLLI